MPRRWRAPTLGAYLARDFSGATGLVIFLLAIGAIVGLNIAASRGREQLAIGFLFGLGFAARCRRGPVLSDYASSDPAVLWQALGATAGSSPHDLTI